MWPAAGGRYFDHRWQAAKFSKKYKKQRVKELMEERLMELARLNPEIIKARMPGQSVNAPQGQYLGSQKHRTMPVELEPNARKTEQNYHFMFVMGVIKSETYMDDDPRADIQERHDRSIAKSASGWDRNRAWNNHRRRRRWYIPFQMEESTNRNLNFDTNADWNLKALKPRVGYWCLSFGPMYGPGNTFEFTDKYLNALSRAPLEFRMQVRVLCARNVEGRAMEITDAALLRFTKSFPNIEEIRLEGATLITNRSIFGILSNRPRIRYLCITGTSDDEGSVDVMELCAKLLDPMFRRANYLRSIQRLELLHQPILEEEYGEGRTKQCWAEVTKKCKHLLAFVTTEGNTHRAFWRGTEFHVLPGVGEEFEEEDFGLNRLKISPGGNSSDLQDRVGNGLEKADDSAHSDEVEELQTSSAGAE